MYLLSWVFIACLLALWSITTWAGNAIALWTMTNAAALSGAVGNPEALQLPAWLVGWFPTESVMALMSALGLLVPYVQGVLQAAPALAGGITATIWVVWAMGAALLLLLGAALHALILIWRRRSRNPDAGVGRDGKPRSASRAAA